MPKRKKKSLIRDEVNIDVRVQDGNVDLNISGQPFYLTPEDARTLARMLIENADKAQKGEGLVTAL